MFPKQYPQWKHPAQWSKTVGKYEKDKIHIETELMFPKEMVGNSLIE